MKGVLMILLAGFILTTGAVHANSCHAGAKDTKTAVKALPGEGKKITIDRDHYFTYEFVKKPSLGTVVFRIQVFGPGGKQVTSFKVYGDYGMPSMRGAHDSGRVEFKTNTKGDYLLPVNIVMPGDWDITITIEKQGKCIFSGVVNFDV